jgi:hypothetical protein
MMRKALRQLRYKCGRHNTDYYTDSAIPDTGEKWNWHEAGLRGSDSSSLMASPTELILVR